MKMCKHILLLTRKKVKEKNDSLTRKNYFLS